MSAKLHLLTNCQSYPDNNYLEFIETCAKAGITHFQLRQKNWSFSNLAAFGRDLQSILAAYSIPLIVNDNLELALKLDADGLHLGQDDADPQLARARLGPNKIIGLSLETFRQLQVANHLDVIDYVAVGSIFPTLSKRNVRTIWGITGLQKACVLSRHPVIAIGGIDRDNIHEVMTATIDGVAIINSIHTANYPASYIAELSAKLSSYQNRE